MLLLSSLIGRMMNKSNQNDLPVISSSKELQLISIDFGKVQLLRVNGQWRAASEQLTVKQVLQIIQHWQSLLHLKAQPKKCKVPAVQTVLLYFAGLSQPVICKISQSDDETRIIFVSTGLQISLPANEYELYFPVLSLAPST